MAFLLSENRDLPQQAQVISICSSSSSSESSRKAFRLKNLMMMTYLFILCKQTTTMQKHT